MRPRTSQPGPVVVAEAPPADESVLWASRVLRLAVALQCLGVALLMIVQKAPSPLNEYLLYQGVEDDTVRLIDQLVGYAMFGIAASVLLFPIAPVSRRCGGPFNRFPFGRPNGLRQRRRCGKTAVVRPGGGIQLVEFSMPAVDQRRLAL